MPGKNITIQDIMMMHILAFANKEKEEEAVADDLEQVAGWALSRENAPQANWAIDEMRDYPFKEETIKRVVKAFQTNLDNLDELIAQRQAYYMNTPEKIPEWVFDFYSLPEPAPSASASASSDDATSDDATSMAAPSGSSGGSQISTVTTVSASGASKLSKAMSKSSNKSPYEQLTQDNIDDESTVVMKMNPTKDEDKDVFFLVLRTVLYRKKPGVEMVPGTWNPADEKFTIEADAENRKSMVKTLFFVGQAKQLD
jgi:hypothetical protein